MPLNHTSGQLLTIGDAQIYVQESGSPQGPAVLLLHGGLGNLHDFDSIAQRLGTEFRLIAMDLRGHGKSSLGTKALSYAQYQADVLAVLDELQLAQVAIVGFSDGGIVGYRLAASNPERIRALVTLGAQWRLLPDDPSIPMLQGLSVQGWNAMFPQAIAQYSQLNPQGDFGVLLDAVKGVWLDTDCATGYPGEGVAEIRTPTLIVRGDADPFLALSEACALQAQIAGAGLLNIPFVGHSAHDEANAVFLSAVVPFLRAPQPLEALHS